MGFDPHVNFFHAQIKSGAEKIAIPDKQVSSPEAKSNALFMLHFGARPDKDAARITLGLEPKTQGSIQEQMAHRTPEPSKAG